jgi:hypothetical protein
MNFVAACASLITIRSLSWPGAEQLPVNLIALEGLRAQRGLSQGNTGNIVDRDITFSPLDGPEVSPVDPALLG